MTNPIDFGFMSGPTNPVNIQDASNLTGLGMLQKLFTDPNMLRLLAESGSAMGQGQNLAQALGTAASNATQRKAFANTLANQQSNDNALFKQFLNILGSKNVSNFVGPQEDMTTANSITFDDKGITAKFPNPNGSQQQTSSLTDKPLESYTSPMKRTSDARNVYKEDTQNMLPFFNGQTNLSVSDLSGLDPQYAQTVIANDQSNKAMYQKVAENIMANNLRRQQMENAKEAQRLDIDAATRAQKLRLDAADKAQKLNQEFNREQTKFLEQNKNTRAMLAIDASNRAAELKFQRDQILVKLRKEQTPEQQQKTRAELRKKEREIALINKRIAKLDYDISSNDGANTDKFIKEYRQWYTNATNEAMKRLNLNKPGQVSEIAKIMHGISTGNFEETKQAETNLVKTMTPEQYQEYQKFINEAMTRTGVPKSIIKYYKDTFADEAQSETSADKIDQTKWTLPKDPSGNDITWQDVEDTANANNISIKDVLTRIGAIYAGT